MDKILIILSLICFVCEAFGVQARVKLGWLGAALLTLTLLI